MAASEKHTDPPSEAFVLPETTQRLVTILQEGFKQFSPEDREEIEDAMWFAIDLHRREPVRDDGLLPVDHVLEVAEIAIFTLKIRKPAVIKAIFLHDTVEDHFEELATYAGASPKSGKQKKQNAGFAYIEWRFGELESRIVKADTNFVVSKKASITTKHKKYAENFREKILTFTDAFLAKLPDLIHNLYRLTLSDMTRAQKYLLIVDDALARLRGEAENKEPLEMPVESVEWAIKFLEEKKVFLKEIIIWNAIV